jgi:glucose/arabinose dehydrogenase
MWSLPHSMKQILLSLLIFLMWPAVTFTKSQQATKPVVKNGGLILPDGFKATVVADSLPGAARHLAVNSNGNIYVKLRFPDAIGGNILLRDNNGDGKADMIKKFGNYDDKGSYGTGMRIHKGYLYFSSEINVYRVKLDPNKLIPNGPLELIVHDSLGPHEHDAKPLAFDDNGHLYVAFGAPSNGCQVQNRVPGSAGIDGCPLLKESGGIWQFDEAKLNQQQKDGKRYATGLRSVVAMDWNSATHSLYIVAHGRDDLHLLFPKRFSAWQSAVLPAEEFLKIKEGSNAGWPYYYYDPFKQRKILSPEYGGNGEKTGKGRTYTQPIMAFQAHWAPNDLLFYTGNMFPQHYRNGAFIAFHGSTNRSPYPQAGYFICFVPFKNGKPAGNWEIFADGFTSQRKVISAGEAQYRPMGLAMGPDGSLYISETEKGKIWRISYNGNRNKFGPAQLAGMEARKKLPNFKLPNPATDDQAKGSADHGAALYRTYCAGCHQQNGKGDGNLFPPLAGSEWVNGGPYMEKWLAIQTLLKGLQGPVKVLNKPYNSAMPAHAFLPDRDIAALLTYIRSHFGNNSSLVTPGEVSQIRLKLGLKSSATNNSH